MKDQQTTTRRFFPKRKTVACLGLACLSVGVLAAYMAIQWSSLTLALGSVVALLGSVILLEPVIRNPTIEVRADHLILRLFGNAVDLGASHLTEVFRRRRGARSYRFESGTRFYQVTPVVYFHADMLQREFDRLFGVAEVEDTIAKPRQKSSQGMLRNPEKAEG